MQTHTWQLALVTSLTHSSSRSLLLMHLNIFVITAASFVAGDLLTHSINSIDFKPSEYLPLKLIL